MTWRMSGGNYTKPFSPLDENGFDPYDSHPFRILTGFHPQQRTRHVYLILSDCKIGLENVTPSAISDQADSRSQG